MKVDIPRQTRLKLQKLVAQLKIFEKVAVAFSGGVDSSLLLAVAHRVCAGGATALTAISESFPEVERRNARKVASEIGAPLIEFNTNELNDPFYVLNQGDRCYFCRRALFDRAELSIRAEKLGELCYGAIFEDDPTDRPGMKAAQEFTVNAPLVSSGLLKEEIRLLAKMYGLSNWNKPAAPCLASRFPVGTPVTAEGLAQIEMLENALHQLGFQVVRARYFEDNVVIELPVLELGSVQSNDALMQEITRAARRAGFQSVTIDPRGYRRGSVSQTRIIQISDSSNGPKSQSPLRYG